MTAEEFQKSYVDVRRVRTEREYTLLQARAREDNHDVNAPTHFVEKGGNIIGCFNVGPIVLWWMDSRNATVRDSTFALKCMEVLLHSAGINEYALFCNSESPYMDYMEKVGFRKGRQFTFFKKKI